MKLIIFDFEVFKHDTLFGAKILEKNSSRIYQTWNLEDIKDFYEDNRDEIWIGHNNSHYDNYILQGIVMNKKEEDLRKINDDIIERDVKQKLHIPLYYYDLILNHFTGLKTVEAVMGKNISETGVDFNLDRKLTSEEKAKTESYNRDDLDQTYEDFNLLKDEFQLRLEMIREFNLSLDCLKLTGTQIAEKVLHAERIHNIDKQEIKPIIYDNLYLNNQQVLDYYLNEKFKTDEKLEIEICGVKHKLGSGGLHGAREKVICDECLYLDVSGYYNLIMINFDLLPRSIPQEGKKLYEYMYYQQLELKKHPELKLKRGVYKTILLSVFGAMRNKYCNFYDPYKGELVTITGQIFIIDLLEKLEGKIYLFQSNTDGIIVKPSKNSSEEEVLQIVKDWCERTHFVIKPKKIYNIIQRDVNNYLYQDEEGNIEVKGEALKHFACKENPFTTDSFNSKEPLIISKAIVNYLVNGIKPEQTIEKNKENLKLFQFVCKKQSYDWVEYEEIIDGETKTIKLQNVNRVFAMNDENKQGMIYKLKNRNGKISKSRFSSLPDSVFVYNNEILSDKTKVYLLNKIDYNYYIIRSYERIMEFLPK